jgi:hypothetical protein
MNRTRIARLVALALLLAPALAAAVPNTVGFSARIADQGRPVTGAQTFTFTLWAVAEGGNPDPLAGELLWTESKSITVNDGVAATALGDVDPLANPLPALTGAPVWLEVQMGSQIFSPRVAFHSAPFALRAGVAERALAADTADRADSAARADVATTLDGAWTRSPAAVTGPTGGGSITTTTEVAMASSTVTFPAPGVAVVMGQSVFSNGTASNWLDCFLRENGTAFVNFWWDPGDADGLFDQSQSRVQVRAVPAGTFTYSLGCRVFGGTTSFTMANVSVVYLPASL